MSLLSIDPGTMNLSYCILSIPDGKIKKWNKIALAKNMNEGTEKTITSLHNKLNELQDNGALITHEHDWEIVIELQPKSNLRTIVISGALFMYFVALKLAGYPIKKIITRHAKEKLRFFGRQNYTETYDISHIKKGYYRNKKESVEQCKIILVHRDPEYATFFISCKKKDDYSDAYLQGLSYLFPK